MDINTPHSHPFISSGNPPVCRWLTAGVMLALLWLHTVAVQARPVELPDEPVNLALKVDESSVSEDVGVVSVTVTATISPGAGSMAEFVTLEQPLVITLMPMQTEPADADPDTDYSITITDGLPGGAAGQLTIPSASIAGTATLQITPTDDSVVENPQTIRIAVSFTALEFYDITLQTPTLELTLVDDEAMPMLRIAPGVPPSFHESDRADIRVVLVGAATAEAVTVAWSTGPGPSLVGGAEAGADYVAVSSGTVTFPPGTSEQLFSVMINDDNLSERTEDFIVFLGAASGPLGSRVTVNTAPVSVIIMDNDPLTVNLDGPALVGEGAAATYIVSLSPPGTLPGSDVVVSYDDLGGAVGPVAVRGIDYISSSGTLRLSAATPRQTIVVRIRSDDRVEEVEYFAMRLTNTGGDNVALGPRKRVVTGIRAPYVMEFDAATPIRTAEGAVIRLGIQLSGGRPTGILTLNYEILNGTTDDDDHHAAPGSEPGPLSLPPGITAGYIDIVISADLVAELEENFMVRLNGVSSSLDSEAVLLGAQVEREVMIGADAPIVVEISGPASVLEGEQAAYTLNLLPAGIRPLADLSVRYQVVSADAGSAADIFEAGSILDDSILVAGTTGEHSPRALETQDNVDDGGNRRFRFELLAAAGGGGPAPILGVARFVETTVLDNDGDPAALRLTTSESSLDEGSGSTPITITAELIGGVRSTPVDVALSLAGTAMAGMDYATVMMPALRIEAGAMRGTATLTLMPIDDSRVEQDRLIRVAGTASELHVIPADIVLVDGDTAELSISASTTTVAEGAIAEFAISLSAPVEERVSVAWHIRPADDAAATPGHDFIVVPNGMAVFAPDSTVAVDGQVATLDDFLSEAAEGFGVELGSVADSPGGRVTVSIDNGLQGFSIAENDPVRVTLSGPTTVLEGDTAVYTVSLLPSRVMLTETLQVDHATGDAEDDTAVAGTHYRAAMGTLTFATASPQQFAVRTIPNGMADGERAFRISLSNAVGGGGPTPQVAAPITVRILDDDATRVVRLSLSEQTVSEADGPVDITITAVLQGSPLTTATTVILSIVQADTDYTVVLPALIIPDGRTSKTAILTFTPVNDVLAEDTRMIYIRGTAMGLVVVPTTLQLIDDDATMALLDLTGDSVVDLEDAKVFYYTLQFGSALGNGITGGTVGARSTILGSFLPGSPPGDAELQALLRAAHALATRAGLDITDNGGAADRNDAGAFYYALALPDSLGNGTTGGYATLRSTILGSFLPGSPGDTELQALLRRANALLR